MSSAVRNCPGHGIEYVAQDVLFPQGLWDANLLMYVPQTVATGVGSEVTVTNIPHVIVDSLPASGGGLTDTELRATPVPVSGPLTDTQLRASAVPVSGPLTDTQLRASAVPVSGTVTTSPPANASTNVAQLAGTATSVNSGVKDAGTLRVVLATDQPALTNKLLVTPDSVALPANQSVNVNQIAGTATAVNSGVKDAGTLRVVLATDQPALTNKLLVTPDSVALPANQSVNLNQIAGTAADVNSGVKSAGTLRVVLATDQPALTNKLLVTPDSVALPANQSVNAAQFGGTNISTGTGAGGAGIPRVTVSNDSNVLVTPPTLTKATQGATGFSVQSLKDAGRTSIAITASVASTATAETLISVNRSTGLAAVVAGSSLSITTGKRFRICAIAASVRNSTGTVASNVTLNLRAAVAGATTASSPLQMHWMVALPASTVTTLFPTLLIADGFEIDSNGATNTFGFTITHPQWVTGTQVATFDLSVVGFEY